MGFTTREDWYLSHISSLPSFGSETRFLLLFKYFISRYRISKQDLAKNHGWGVLNQFKGSTVAAVTSAYDDHTFHPWLFNHPPQNSFDNLDTRKQYIDWLLRKLDKKSVTELKYRDFAKNNGRALLEKYGGSPTAVIASLELVDSSPNSSLSDSNPDLSNLNSELGGSSKRKKPQGYWVRLFSYTLPFPIALIPFVLSPVSRVIC